MIFNRKTSSILPVVKKWLLAAVLSIALGGRLAHAQAITPIYSFTNGPAYPESGLTLGPDGNFYGMTTGGGPLNDGTVFRMAINGALTTLVNFNGTNGASPGTALTLGPDGNLYGTTGYGGSGGDGTVFKLSTTGTLTTLASFSNTNGDSPNALVLGLDGNFYGSTENGGGTNFAGTIFKVTTNGLITSLFSFSKTNGDYPVGALALGPDGNFYGATAQGGNLNLDYGYGCGTLFKVSTNGTLTTLIKFNNTNGDEPEAGLTLGPDGNFYGTTGDGGTSGDGTIFKLSTNGTLTTLASFRGTNGEFPQAALTLGAGGIFYGSTFQGGSNIFDGTIFQVSTNGALTTLVNFASTNGAHPEVALAVGPDGNFYGTTAEGGGDGSDGAEGTIFQMTTNGVLTTLVGFSLANGEYPDAALTVGPGGNFYGTTYFGGSNSLGTMFAVTTNGILTTLVNFNNAGASPDAAMTLGPDGNFYGVNFGGGVGYGSVFQVTPNGVLTNLVSFANTNGDAPYAPLTLGADGDFYGITIYGGSSGDGTLFKVSTNGAFTSLVNFTGANGENPQGALTLGTDGNLYGTTAYGGGSGDGTIFKITTNGTFTTLTSFAGTNGEDPAALALGLDGNFYGTTAIGGGNGDGTIFKVTTNGTLTTLDNFSNSNTPSASLILGPDGSFYGTTLIDNTSAAMGTVFKVTTNGTLTSLTSFTNSSEPGASPRSFLTLGPDGNFYGTIYGGGSYNIGEIFRLDLPPDLLAGQTNQVTVSGTNIVLVANVFGTGPLYYEWLSNNVVVAADCGLNAFTVPNGSPARPAIYSAIVTNAYGSLPLNFGPTSTITKSPGGGILSYTSYPNSVNSLWYTTNLAAGPWQLGVTNLMADTNGFGQWSFTNNPAVSQIYYRMTWQAP